MGRRSWRGAAATVPANYVGPVELVERALQAPGLPTSWDTIQPGPRHTGPGPTA